MPISIVLLDTSAPETLAPGIALVRLDDGDGSFCRLEAAEQKQMTELQECCSQRLLLLVLRQLRMCLKPRRRGAA
ncbi:hypothetical protein A7D33_11065 [Candidatus Methylacidiphilum fumarolicum]|nr:hypothetical protein A7D33_11065 [Candidatus Methylacidiphilum fumarolicum]